MWTAAEPCGSCGGAMNAAITNLPISPPTGSCWTWDLPILTTGRCTLPDLNVDSGGALRIMRRRNERSHYKPSNITTDWVMLDLGFANFNDRTVYTSRSECGQRRSPADHAAAQ